MSHQPRYFENKINTLLHVPDPNLELRKSIDHLIVANCPPSDPWPHNSCPLKGLLTGPTSLAYLFLHVARTHPSLTVQDGRFTAKQLCLAYLSCGQSRVPLNPHDQNKIRIGITSEALAFSAVRAAATADPDAVAKLATDALEPPADPTVCEYFYGHAGLLALLRLVKAFVPESEATMNEVIATVIQRILAAERPWTFHGHEYLGAAHGTVAIVAQVVLSDPSYASHPAILETLEQLLDLQLENGNWTTTPEVHQEYVQWCHGAPGFVMSLVAIRDHFSADLKARIDAAVAKGRELIWEKGLLTKEPNLCHGIIGNALALEGQQREHFLAQATSEKIEKGLTEGVFIKGDDPWGLMWGEAGRA